eukprot:TRINITY_DN585_c0_g1_i1.p1 TRINITY_DN585_c0_g1~~TRINITY_DN585_c0_g1_i1.p1  ORF type:complete len:219 (+),score=21.50 TRINITY_DN585_c0_g1_i1:132-788(+)
MQYTWLFSCKYRFSPRRSRPSIQSICLGIPRNPPSSYLVSLSPSPSIGQREHRSLSMDKIKSLFSKEEVPLEEKDWWTEINEEFTLTKKQRLYGFAFTFGMGMVCSFLSVMFLPSLLIHPGKFAAAYTLGNILSLGSSAFIVGPMRQIKTMFKPVRAGATIIYLVSMGLTFFFIRVRSSLGVLLCLGIQFCALIWYCASYIPFARSLLTSCFSSVVAV